MFIVRPTSLAATLDTVAETIFYQQPLSADLRQEIAMLLVNRQSKVGLNTGFFIPFASESETKCRLFSGEYLRTDFARSHIYLIDSTRILYLLDVDNHYVSRSIQVAQQCMDMACYCKFCPKGECKSLTIAFMRYLASAAVNDSALRLSSFMAKLSSYRDGRGGWGGFPFFYTVLMLSELDDPMATQELQYSSSLYEKLYAQIGSDDPYSTRRQAILTKALARS